MEGRDDDVATSGSDERLSRVCAVINGKGGVGKTTVTANVAGQLAMHGYRVLAVDLDLSGNLKLDLGYVGHEHDDDGKGLVDAIWNDQPLRVIGGVRNSLDVVPGGRHLEMLAVISQTPMGQELPGGGVPQAFAKKLAELVDDAYDLVLLDCAPGNPVLQDMALAATRYVLIPTKTDPAGWDGLRMVGPRVKKARADNHSLTYLGVVLFGHQTNASRILKTTRARLGEVNGTVPLLDAYIRHSETAAHDCRRRGQLAHELARDATVNKRERLAALRIRRRGGDNVIELPAALSAAADSLAGDYAQLAREVLTRIAAAEASTPITTTGR
jgi:cellulose biosynthesis protein BcsQ